MSKRLKTIREEIAEIDYVCYGTLQRRIKICGKPNCACATDKRARHGPYYQWKRLHKGRVIQTSLPPAVVPAFINAVGNYRRLRRLLRLWAKEFLNTVKREIDVVV